MKELFLCLLLLSSMAIAFFLTKSKKKDHCDDCNQDCSQCHAFQDFYQEYRKDHPKER